ncbi:RnfABCDGE type electron transport complex subunit D [Roseiconus lacunae]|uniref:RnfABCDGE type electron transport complex subunit D n=1 Tax=Roseiconus lacunae TaxID=2605694 RepID=A0ABT7PQR0_9BACT|nr:RnfABCDGE type electron transport complex subunit D [Roseiconus lacunae]MDM4018813.1 RnfABCDGE type electron transport complex subunit D [Roseiconus lacunae]
MSGFQTSTTSRPGDEDASTPNVASTAELPRIDGNSAARKEAVEVASPKEFRWRDWLTLENRFLAPALITSILLAGQLSFGFLESWSRTFTAIGVCIATELILGRLIVGRYPHLASAYISGISVGILIRSPFVWPYAMCAGLSIMSKYVLRMHNRHLWNPSNFGVSAMLFLYPAAVASLSIQWGNSLLPMAVVWCLGSLIISRLKRFHICATYVLSFVALAAVRSWLTESPFLANVAPLTGPMYQLFVFFMITDPKTTVRSKRGQCLVAFLVALVEMGLRLGEVIHAPYYALFLVGPIALAIDMHFTDRTESAPPTNMPSKDFDGHAEPAPSVS